MCIYTPVCHLCIQFLVSTERAVSERVSVLCVCVCSSQSANHCQKQIDFMLLKQRWSYFISKRMETQKQTHTNDIWMRRKFIRMNETWTKQQSIKRVHCFVNSHHRDAIKCSTHKKSSHSTEYLSSNSLFIPNSLSFSFDTCRFSYWLLRFVSILRSKGRKRGLYAILFRVNRLFLDDERKDVCVY